MQAARRAYLFIVAAVSLGMLVVGLANVGGTLIEFVLSPGAVETTLRQTLATTGALALVGLPIWALHWSIAQRFARRDPAERASALRRLYLYLVAGSLLLAIGILAAQLVEQAVSLLLESGRREVTALVRTAWYLALVLAFWAYHFRIAAADRAAVGEVGASATLRRWYAYGAQAIALIALLFGARELLTITALNLLGTEYIAGASNLPSAVGQTLTALAILVFHARWTASGAIGLDDRRSTLRAVEGFGVLALCVAVTLTEASRALYYGLARVLGVENPGGVTGDLPAVLVSPVATILIFGTAWALLRHGVMQDAAGTEAPRQAGVRRLYTHLVALAALAALATGLVGLLWTLADLALSEATAINPTTWRNQVSLFLAIVAVGLPVWIAHWRPNPPPAERFSLSRRLYLFAAMLGGVLALLGSGAYLIARLLNTLLGVATGPLGSDFARALATSLVALAVAGYHWRMLRLDGQRRSAEPPPAVGVPSLVVEIHGASEAEVRAALGALPASARYHLRAGGPAAAPE